MVKNKNYLICGIHQNPAQAITPYNIPAPKAVPIAKIMKQIDNVFIDECVMDKFDNAMIVKKSNKSRESYIKVKYRQKNIGNKPILAINFLLDKIQTYYIILLGESE